MKLDRLTRADKAYGDTEFYADDEFDELAQELSPDELYEEYPELLQLQADRDRAWINLANTEDEVFAPTPLEGLRKAVAAGKPIVEAQKLLTSPKGISAEARRRFLRGLIGR